MGISWLNLVKVGKKFDILFCFLFYLNMEYSTPRKMGRQLYCALRDLKSSPTSAEAYVNGRFGIFHFFRGPKDKVC